MLDFNLLVYLMALFMSSRRWTNWSYCQWTLRVLYLHWTPQQLRPFPFERHKKRPWTTEGINLKRLLGKYNRIKKTLPGTAILISKPDGTRGQTCGLFLDHIQNSWAENRLSEPVSGCSFAKCSLSHMENLSSIFRFWHFQRWLISERLSWLTLAKCQAFEQRDFSVCSWN